MYAQTNAPYPNRIALVCDPYLGPFVQNGPLGAFDPRRDLEVYVDGQLQVITSAYFDPANNRYLLFTGQAINLKGVIQIVHRVPDPPFQTQRAAIITGASATAYAGTVNGSFTFTGLSSFAYTASVTGTVTDTLSAIQGGSGIFSISPTDAAATYFVGQMQCNLMTTSQSLTISKISGNYTGGASLFTCAIYDSTGTTRLVYAGDNAFNVSAAGPYVVSISPVTLPAGTYWYVTQGTTNFHWSPSVLIPPTVNDVTTQAGYADNIGGYNAIISGPLTIHPSVSHPSTASFLFQS